MERGYAHGITAPSAWLSEAEEDKVRVRRGEKAWVTWRLKDAADWQEEVWTVFKNRPRKREEGGCDHIDDKKDDCHQSLQGSKGLEDGSSKPGMLRKAKFRGQMPGRQGDLARHATHGEGQKETSSGQVLRTRCIY